MNFLKFEHLEFAHSNFKELFLSLNKFKGKHIAFHSPYKDDYPYDLTSPSSIAPEVDDFIRNVNKLYLESKSEVCGVIVHPPVDDKGDQELFLKRLERLRTRISIHLFLS